MCERRVIVAAMQPIVPGTHVDPPAVGQILGRLQLGEHDRVIPQCRTDDPIAALDQHIDEPV